MFGSLMGHHDKFSTIQTGPLRSKDSKHNVGTAHAIPVILPPISPLNFPNLKFLNIIIFVMDSLS